jgi:hypothetical protein
MDLFSAMLPNNGAEVSQLISNGSNVNARNASGLTVVQYAAVEYSSQISLAGSSTEKAQQLRHDWAVTIDSLVASNYLFVGKVTIKDWNSSQPPSIIDLAVDAMLHDLGLIKSELAAERGYAEGLGSRRVNGQGQSPPTLFSNNFKTCVC